MCECSLHGGKARRVPAGQVGGDLWDTALKGMANGPLVAETTGAWDAQACRNMQRHSLESFNFSNLTSFPGISLCCCEKNESSWQEERDFPAQHLFQTLGEGFKTCMHVQMSFRTRAFSPVVETRTIRFLTMHLSSQVSPLFCYFCGGDG